MKTLDARQTEELFNVAGHRPRLQSDALLVSFYNSHFSAHGRLQLRSCRMSRLGVAFIALLGAPRYEREKAHSHGR
jgi:hypothetical protein